MIDFQRIGIFGRSKSGKSTLMDRLVRNRKRLIVFDEIDERAHTAANEGLVRINCLNELQDRVDRDYATGFRFWFQPRHSDLVQALSDLSTYLIDIQTQFGDRYGIERRPSITLTPDEMADCYPNQIMKKGQDGFSRMCRMGRHKGIHLIGATQRPAEVSTKFRGQLEKRFFFSLQETVDLEAVAKMGGAHGSELAEKVRLLPKLDYIRMENGRFTPGRITFPG